MTFRSQDRGQNNKRSLTFCTGVRFSSSSNFNKNVLKLIRLSCRFRKCIVSYKLNAPILEGGQSSTATDHDRPRPIWALTFDPLIHILPDFLLICKSKPFLNHLGDPINLSPFSLKSDQLENLTPVKKVNDFLLIWPLSQERNIVWISCNLMFCCYDPRKNVTWIST